MYSSFSSENNSLLISTKAWSDFASHIPLIRSFSLGSNFPPQYPLFPGEAIKYHFLFYTFVGLLEKAGVPIGHALNIPSILGFVFLTFMIYLVGKTIFKSKIVGLLGVIFIIFNSSLSYFYYFKNNPFSISSIKNIFAIDNFQSFAPYGDGMVSAFWNLNIYTNQRHLAFSFGLSLFVIYILIRPIFEKRKEDLRVAVILGVVLGFSFFLHLAVLLMTGIVILSLGVLFPKIRKSAIIVLAIAGLISLPQYFYLNSSDGFKMLLNPGYLIANNFSINNFIEFWIYNLGISIFLIFLGFIFANRNQRKFFLSIIPIFIIGNLIQFSPEIAANHKFFNYVSIFTNMFCAFALIVLWKKNNFLKPIVLAFSFFMIFGGIIDIFPLVNDHKITIKDYMSNPDSVWILRNSDPDSIFLNTTYLYDSASLAGRKIFFGWPYFAWSQGYDTYKRGDELKQMLGANDKNHACQLLRQNNIDFVSIKIEPVPNPDLPPISKVWENEFIFSYRNSSENLNIYSVKQNCK